MNSKSHSKKCRVCDQKLNKIKYVKGEETGDNIALYKCKNCRSYFSNIEFRKQLFSKFSEGSIDVYNNKNHVFKRVDDILSYSLEKNWLPSNDINFLDIGCGVGWSLLIAKKKGFNACGIEPMKIAADYGNNILNVNIYNSLFKSDIFNEKKFDFIMMDQVLEHVPNPLETIVDAFRLLKPGGIFFLAVPPLDWSRIWLSMSYQFSRKFITYLENIRYLNRLILLVRKYDTFLFPEGHINYFSTQSIKILSEHCNAKLIGQYHIDRKRSKYFPFLKLSTGSFFLKKK